jgi:HSP20 family protein
MQRMAWGKSDQANNSKIMNATETQNPQRMQDEQNRGYVTPPANISANQNEYLLELEMPGVDKTGLEITAEANELTIVGRRKEELQDGQAVYCESPQADYRRVFEFGVDVDAAKISAEMDQGVLRLHLPKSEKVKPRKIPISG